MKYPNFDEEKKLWKQGYEFVVGLDEAGRGPLAGPVVASAVMILSKDKKHSNIQLNVGMFSGVRDSKKLSEKQREFFYGKLINHPNIRWGAGVVSEKVIDKINILNATKVAMKQAIEECRVNEMHDKDSYLLLDGNFILENMNISQKSIIKGDEKVFSCTAAGIIAKVTRDRIMKKLHKKYPHYNFDKHKGYGTELHVKNLQAFGPCPIHRKTFWPVSGIAQN